MKRFRTKKYLNDENKRLSVALEAIASLDIEDAINNKDVPQGSEQAYLFAMSKSIAQIALEYEF